MIQRYVRCYFCVTKDINRTTQTNKAVNTNQVKVPTIAVFNDNPSGFPPNDASTAIPKQNKQYLINSHILIPPKKYH